MDDIAKNISSNSTSQAVNEGPELSLVELIRVLNRYRVLGIGIALSCLLASIVYAFTATPMYRAETVLVPARGTPGGLGQMMSQFGGSISSIASMVGIGGGGGSRGSRLVRGEALTTMTSRAYIQDFIAEKNLLPILFEGRWDAENKSWLAESEDDIPTLSDGFDLFRNSVLKTDEDPLTGIVTLSVEWKDPVLAADWANSLVGRLNARMRSDAITETDNMIDYLNQELERTKVVELRQAIFYMIEQSIGERTGARVQDDYAFKIINPALPSDKDKYISPDRPMIIALGAVLGIGAGIFATFMAFAFAHLRREYRETA